MCGFVRHRNVHHQHQATKQTRRCNHLLDDENNRFPGSAVLLCLPSARESDPGGSLQDRRYPVFRASWWLLYARFSPPPCALESHLQTPASGSHYVACSLVLPSEATTQLFYPFAFGPQCVKAEGSSRPSPGSSMLEWVLLGLACNFASMIRHSLEVASRFRLLDAVARAGAMASEPQRLEATRKDSAIRSFILHPSA